MQNDILFDNIYIGHSIADAEALAKETFHVKESVEKAEEEESKPAADEKTKEKPKSPMDLVFMDDPVLYIREKLDLFLTIAKRDPVQAIQFVPEVAGAIGVLAVTIIALLIGAIGAGGAAAPSKEQVKTQAQKAKKSTVDAKNTVVENVTSSAQLVQEEVKQRNTRSTAQS